MKPKQPHSNETQEQVLRAARERVSLRGIERIFNVCRQTGAKWIRDYIKQLPVIADTLLLYEVGDVLEIDGLWSFVGEKEQKRWVWVALCRRPVKSLPSILVSVTNRRRDSLSNVFHFLTPCVRFYG